MLYHRLLPSSGLSGGWPVWNGSADGSEVAISPSVGYNVFVKNLNRTALAAFDTQRVAVALTEKNTTTSDSRLLIKMLDVSTTTPSVVGQLAIITATFSSSENVGFGLNGLFPFDDGTGRILVVYYYQTASTSKTYFTVITRSGNTIVQGNTISATTSNTNFGSGCFYNGSANFFYASEYNLFSVYAHLLSFTGSTVSFNGTLNTYGAFQATFSVPLAVPGHYDTLPIVRRFNDTTFLLVTADYLSSYTSTYARVVTLSGTTPSYGSVFTLSSTDTNMGYGSLLSVDTNKMLHVYRPTSSSNITISYLNRSGTTVTGFTDQTSVARSQTFPMTYANGALTQAAYESMYNPLALADSTNALLAANYTIGIGTAPFTTNGPHTTWVSVPEWAGLCSFDTNKCISATVATNGSVINCQVHYAP